MGIGDIISDALVYPFHNIKALVLYVILGIIAGLIGGAAIASIIGAFTTTGLGALAFDILGIVGVIVFILVLFLIEGYGLDIINISKGAMIREATIKNIKQIFFQKSILFKISYRIFLNRPYGL